MTLTLTEQCTLRCSYCHARRSDRRMDPETADRAVDLLSEHSTDAERVSISFYGGEPLLERRSMSRILTRARRQAPASQTVECTSPTNGLLLTPEAIERCREEGVDLALSIDGTAGPAERRFPNGADASPLLEERLATLCSHGGANVLVRMTVTPSNVEYLSENVKSLARLGARTIAYQPALELDWDASAVSAWQREHERILTFLNGRRALGTAGVDVPALRAIRDRLLGKPRRACGAGVWHVAVATDGRVFPCYRFVFERSSEFELGTVATGFCNSAALNRLRVLQPDDQEPEDGACSTCSARDGCTHFCPATGYLLAGDPRAVPRVVCELMRAQVAAVRATLAGPAPMRTSAGRSWTAAFLVAAGALSTAACGGRVDGNESGSTASGGSRQTALDAASDAANAAGGSGGTGGSSWVGGVCTGGTTWDAGAGGMCTGGTTWDAGAGGVCGGSSSWDAGSGGICPAMTDAAVDAPVSDASPDAPLPGICGGIC